MKQLLLIVLLFVFVLGGCASQGVQYSANYVLVVVNGTDKFLRIEDLHGHVISNKLPPRQAVSYSVESRIGTPTIVLMASESDDRELEKLEKREFRVPHKTASSHMPTSIEWNVQKLRPRREVLGN